MNRRLYYFGIFILILTIAAGLLQSILYWLLGGAFMMLESFMNWYLVGIVTSLLGSLTLLKYFQYKDFRFAFGTLIVSTLANLCQSVLLFFILSGMKEWQQYYVPMILVVLGTTLLYSLSLIFSSTREKRWLKNAGAIMLLMASALLMIFVASLYSRDVLIKINLEKLGKGVELFASLIPVPFILNFFDEVRMLKKTRSKVTLPEYIESLIGLTGMIVFAFTLTFGLTVWGEGSTKLYWQNKNAAMASAFAKRCEEGTFTNSKGESLKYLVLKPKDYDPRKKYPLVVSLPYGGYEASAAQELASDANRYRYPAFLFVPYCPEGSGWGGIPNYPTMDEIVFDAILELEKEMSIDVNRIYVTGVSRGGYGSWHFITTRPDMFAAAIPISGAGDPQRATQIKNVSVWAFHGALDRNVPVSGSRDMIDAIKKAGGKPKYTEFPDKAHDIWYEVTQTSGLWDWLFKQRRDSRQSLN